MKKNVSKSEAAEALLAQLKNPIDPKFVKCRVGAVSKDKKKGIALFYIDAREVMKRLDEICGVDGWERREVETAHGVICDLSIRMPYEGMSGEKWVTKADAGEFTKASTLKGASSDAFKRAAVNFGIGRYLYYIPNTWYPLDSFGRFVEKPTLPSWATPQKDLEDWEDIAVREYDPARDAGLDEVDFTDLQAEEELKRGEDMRKAITANLKKKSND